MPQKIEISTPTDGMTDERLAEMLDFAERMAGLKTEQPKVIDAVAPSRACRPASVASDTKVEVALATGVS